MVIYNVTIKTDLSIVDEWIQWMKEEHLNDVMSSGCFTERRLCRLLDQDESDGVTFSAQYFCASKEDYDRYVREYGPEMRERASKKFGDRFVAFRSVMEEIA